jgi:hypothetical protein
MSYSAALGLHDPPDARMMFFCSATALEISLSL